MIGRVASIPVTSDSSGRKNWARPLNPRGKKKGKEGFGPEQGRRQKKKTGESLRRRPPNREPWLREFYKRKKKDAEIIPPWRFRSASKTLGPEILQEKKREEKNPRRRTSTWKGKKPTTRKRGEKEFTFFSDLKRREKRKRSHRGNRPPGKQGKEKGLTIMPPKKKKKKWRSGAEG